MPTRPAKKLVLFYSEKLPFNVSLKLNSSSISFPFLAAKDLFDNVLSLLPVLEMLCANGTHFSFIMRLI